MDKDQERLKKEKRKAKAMKEREKSKREKEKREQLEREFQELGECRLFAPCWGKLMKIGAVLVFSFPGLFVLLLPGIDFGSRILGLVYNIFFLPSYIKDIRQLLFPLPDVVINEKGILVQSFWTSPGQIMWENVEKLGPAHVITPVGRAGLFVEGFEVKFKNKKVVSEGQGFLKGIYVSLSSLEFFKYTRITVPEGLDTDKLWVAVNYFYGRWEKEQEAAKKAEQKAQEEKERVEERKKRLERRWEAAQSGGRDGEDSASIE